MSYKVLKRNSLSDSKGYQITVIRPEDIECIRIWRNQQIDILRQKKEITQSEQVDYFEREIWPTFSQSYPKQILFSFLYNGKCIGYGGVTSVDWEAKRGEISFLVETSRLKDEKLYQLDFTSFLRLVGRLAFEDLHFHRLFTETFAFRKNHMKILENFGFKYEGTLRDHVFKKEQWNDSVMHGLLAKEFKDVS